MRPILASLLALFSVGMASAMEPQVFPLWPEQAPVGDGTFEKTEAKLTLHRPEKPGGTVLVICPGGGYSSLVREGEGHGIARWLNAHGITGVVLEYRLPRGRAKVPLLDAQRALRTVRAHAEGWGCDPAKVGIIGFSAGGHLAATAATRFDEGDRTAKDPVERQGCRPDFAVLVYPVITMGEGAHQGSRYKLLGPAPISEAVADWSLERHVGADTVPSYICLAADDDVVPPQPNGMAFFDRLQAAKVPSQLDVFEKGGHGFSLHWAQGKPCGAWPDLFRAWAGTHGFKA